MEKKDHKKLTKGQLIKLLLKKVNNHEDLLDNDPFKDEVAQEPKKPTPPPRTGKWESVSCKSVNEDIILPPPDGYKPIPKPRTDRPLKIQNARRPPKPTRKPPPVPQVEEHITNVPKIKELNRALKGHSKSYSMDMEDHIVTLPEKGLKTRPYNIDMEKKGLKKYDYNIDMEKKDHKKLTKGQLIKLLLKKVNNHEDLLDNNPFKDEVAQEPKKPTPPPRTGKWESVSRKSVNEDIILPPPDGYKPIPKPRTDRPLKIQNARRPPKPTRKPPPVPQVEEHMTNVPKIKELNRALKGHSKSYEIELQDNLNSLNHFTKTRTQTESHLEDLLNTMKGFKFIETPEVTLKRILLIQKLGSV